MNTLLTTKITQLKTKGGKRLQKAFLTTRVVGANACVLDCMFRFCLQEPASATSSLAKRIQEERQRTGWLTWDSGLA